MDKNKDSLPLKINAQARTRRHKRVFLRSASALDFIRNVIELLVPRRLGRNRVRAHFARIEVKDSFSRFTRHSMAFIVALLVVTSISPSRVLETGFTASFIGDTDFIEGHEEEGEPLPPLMINEEGFILKTSPVSKDVSRIGFTDSVKHSVVSGETLSSIAELYGVHVQTVMWENNLNDYSILKVGQALTIPPVDGVSHVVETEKETLGAIAKKYSVEEEIVAEHNKLDGDTIIKGQKLFIPGGKKPKPVIAARTGTRTDARYDTYNQKVVTASNAAPTAGKRLIFPTKGDLTQGFRRGHYALDIGNRSKPDVWASAEGTIIKSAGGCAPREVKWDRGCNGGYGNHVIIDHGDGLQTLYAHLETLYVSNGQTVTRGQALGKMGNTGRTYGATGIHVHMECVSKGAKVNCLNLM
ncbi:hypothetical protein COV82_04775 [Candidatus Peregrinibacteria bacterium CG11_big_fil_rev_8_21_14_0_20_46_8]|nr:MAG: hypothetical protein COV82_04775 [Candidatus Peregrinibacteria bacterium CG11_big_fil_rev_8_21_14_0_20_46_8]